MPDFLFKRWHGLHIIWSFILIAVMSLIMMVYQWVIGSAGLVVCALLIYYTYHAERTFRKELNQQLGMLSYRVKKAGKDVVSHMPVGIIIYNEDLNVSWHNSYAAKIFGHGSIIDQPISELLPVLKNRKEKEKDKEKDKEPVKLECTVGKLVYQLELKPADRIVYLTDITAYKTAVSRYNEERLAMGIVMMDNLDEVTQGMDDQSRSIMMAKVTGEITEWAQRHNLYLRRTAPDRYLILMNQKALKALEQSRFELLDEVRDLTMDQKIPLTISIGIASGNDSLTELGALAQTSLDMALGRGGDQVAIRIGDKLTFHGGRSNAIEKRTRVRARVVAHALRDLIKECDKVIIMGHKFPDMDAIGAAIGVLKAAHVTGKEGYIVLEGINPSIQRLMELINEDDKLNRWFITPEQAMQITNASSLVVVVDTHKASMLAEPRLLQMSPRKMIVDHHRRGEEFIQDATLVYMEPYASSTCELVTELLQYINDRLTMGVLEATILLAGIVMDTKSFFLHTGSRTFEAASFLRRNGADPTMVQRLLKEDLAAYIKRSEVIRDAVVLYDQIALAVTRPGQQYPQLLIAQAADTLLSMTGIMASFVISERPDGLIGVSARSLGKMNVQVVMERMGGGGHLTNAATQLNGTLEQAEQQLRAILKDIHEKGDTEE